MALQNNNLIKLYRGAAVITAIGKCEQNDKYVLAITSPQTNCGRVGFRISHQFESVASV